MNRLQRLMNYYIDNAMIIERWYCKILIITNSEPTTREIINYCKENCSDTAMPNIERFEQLANKIYIGLASGTKWKKIKELI